MAPTVLRAVAQAKASPAVVSHNNARAAPAKVMAQKASQLAAAIASNAAAAKVAMAEEGFTLSVPEVSLPPVDIPSAGGISDLFVDNPILIGGVVALVALPVGVTALLRAADGGAGVKPTSVARALQALEEDPRVILVDVRNKAEVKAQGSPDLRSVKRSAVSLPFTSIVKGEVVVDEAFGEKFSKLRGVSEESLVIFLDADGSLAKSAANAIEGVEKVYYVQGGAEAWAETAPWRAPSAGLSLSLPDLKAVGKNINALADDFKEAPSLTKAGIAAGAIAGAGFLLFNEIEVLLELAGLFAAGNFALKLLFADEREKTFTEIKTLVDEKVAIQDVGSDLNKIAKAVLEEVPGDAPAASPAEPAAAVAEPEEAPAATSDAKEAKEWIENWKAKSA